ncbi:MAG: hypothetical protein Q9184_007310 [Pyrenodesmia sp. 2 TL-2023]
MAAGMIWVGSSPEKIEAFGLKHTARDLAVKASIPVVPGSDGLISSKEDAVKESERLGFPVMLKATAGSGGVGLATCSDIDEVRNPFATVKSRGETLFKNAEMLWSGSTLTVTMSRCNSLGTNLGMQFASARESALSNAGIKRSSRNARVLQDETFIEGNTMTKFLTNFNRSSSAIDVVSARAYTTVQYYTVFLGPAVVALCGARMEILIDGTPSSMWTRLHMKAKQKPKIGFFAALPFCLPVDPRQRICCSKANPSRVFPPVGQVSWGGSCMALYNVESPSGYQLTGLTIPAIDILGSKPGYSFERPRLFEDFDQLVFHEVEEEEFERQLKPFERKRYEYEWEKVEFDMEEHKKLLNETREEVPVVKEKQAKGQKEMASLQSTARSGELAE